MTKEIRGMASGYDTVVGEYFQVPCFVCYGNGWLLETWHVQSKDKTDPRVVKRCDKCDDQGMVWAAEAISGHIHEMVPQAAPDVNNNFQGTLKCKTCSMVIMG